MSVQAWSPRDEIHEVLRDDAKAYGVTCRRGQNALDLAGGWAAFPFRVVAVFTKDDLGYALALARAFRTREEAERAFRTVCDLGGAAGVSTAFLSRHARDGAETVISRKRLHGESTVSDSRIVRQQIAANAERARAVRNLT